MYPFFLYSLSKLLPEEWEERQMILGKLEPEEFDNHDLWEKKLIEADSFLTSFPSLSFQQPLSPIFERFYQNNSPTKPKFKYPIQPLSIHRSDVFPQSVENRGEDETEEIWQAFHKQIRVLLNQEEKIDRLAQGIFAAYRRYTWCLAHNEGLRSLSLYDYVKARTSIAICLLEAETDTSYPFTLLCGDISGIQEFIYNIHSSKAAMTLKGRSFYLHVMLDSIIQEILKQTELVPASLIYSSGGKFYMLLPTHQEKLKTISKIESELGPILFEEFQNELYIAFDWISFQMSPFPNLSTTTSSEELTPAGFAISSLSDVWESVSAKVGFKKRRRFESHIKDGNEFDRIFRGEDLEMDLNATDKVPCAVTGRPTEEIAENCLNPDAASADRAYVRPEIKQQFELGRHLRDSPFFERMAEPNSKPAQNWYSFLKLEHYYRLGHLNRKGIMGEITLINPESPAQSIPDGLERKTPPPSVYHDILFYGGNYQAEKQDGEGEFKLLEYSDLAAPDEETGFNKLAVLRMDVDNLGSLFVKQVAEMNDLPTLADYSQLSGQLDVFFAGYINDLRNQPHYKDRINVIYAGGDDLCAVGRWKEIIQFTEDIQQAFLSFTCGEKFNEDEQITLSAGISIVPPKYPISKATELAHQALSKAKDFKGSPPIGDTPKKNALHLLGVTLSWDADYDFVKYLREKFGEYLQQGELSRGFLYKLSTFRAVRNSPRTDRYNLEWWWQSVYTLSQFMTRTEDPELRELLKTIKTAITVKNPHASLRPNKIVYNKITFQAHPHHMLDLIWLGARLADYDKRKTTINTSYI